MTQQHLRRLGSLAAAVLCGAAAVTAAVAGGLAPAHAHSGFGHHVQVGSRPVASTVAARRALRWRGGATVPKDMADMGEEEEEEEEEVEVYERSIKVTVGTAVGSPHLDLKARFDLKGSTTVGALKSHVERQMKGESRRGGGWFGAPAVAHSLPTPSPTRTLIPKTHRPTAPTPSAGNPPAALQRLVYGVRLLSDDATLDSLLGGAADEDEFDEFDEGEAASGAGAPRELSIILDMLPPLPADKSLPFVSAGARHPTLTFDQCQCTRSRDPWSTPNPCTINPMSPTSPATRGKDASSWTPSELAALACGLEPARTNHHATFTGVPRVYSNIFVCP